MIRYLAHALLIILSNVLTRKILIFYEFYACISIGNADVSLSNLSSHAIRSDVVVILGFRLGDGSTIVFQQHADVMSEFVPYLSDNTLWVKSLLIPFRFFVINSLVITHLL